MKNKEFKELKISAKSFSRMQYSFASPDFVSGVIINGSTYGLKDLTKKQLESLKYVPEFENGEGVLIWKQLMKWLIY